MATYDVSHYGPPSKYGTAPVFVYDVSPFTVDTFGYGNLLVKWSVPSGAWNTFVLVRNLYGPPFTAADGDVVVTGTNLIPPPTQFVDTVPPGRTYWYAIFLEDSPNPASPNWVRCGAVDGTAFVDHGYWDQMWDLLPRVFKYVQYQELTAQTQVDNESLKSFIRLFAGHFDMIRTDYESVMSINDPSRARYQTVASLGQQLGVSISPLYDPRRYRLMVREATRTWQRKGTTEGTEDALRMITGWDTAIVLGPNRMLDADQSAAYHPIRPDWSPYSVYAVGDTVKFQGFLFRALVANVNKVPSSSGTPTTEWNPVPNTGVALSNIPVSLVSNWNWVSGTTGWTATNATLAVSTRDSIYYYMGRAYPASKTCRVTMAAGTGSVSVASTATGLTVGANYVARTFVYVTPGLSVRPRLYANGQVDSTISAVTGQWVTLTQRFTATATTAPIVIQSATRDAAKYFDIGVVLVLESTALASPLYNPVTGGQSTWGAVTYTVPVGYPDSSLSMTEASGFVSPSDVSDYTLNSFRVTNTQGSTTDVGLQSVVSAITATDRWNPDRDQVARSAVQLTDDDAGTVLTLSAHVRAGTVASGLVQPYAIFYDANGTVIGAPQYATTNQTLFDNFERSVPLNGSSVSSAPSKTWVDSGGKFACVGGRVTCGTGGDGTFKPAYVASGHADASVWGYVPQQAGTGAGLLLRYQDASNYVRISGSDVVERVGGTDHSLGTFTASPGDRLSATAAGTNLKVFVNRVQVLNVTLTGPTTPANHGIWSR